MASSETVKAIINQAYKQNRHEDDVNQARSVQPWGSDGDKRRYFLVEGQDDSAFRVYRESNPAGLQRTWWSVAGSIEELNALAEKLATKDGGPKARILAQKMLGAIPRFEAGEEASPAISEDQANITNSVAETPTKRIPTNAERTLQAARSGVLHVRGSDSWQAHEVHVLGRRRRVQLRLYEQTVRSKYWGKHASGGGTNHDRKRTSDPCAASPQRRDRR